jgi:anti-anti-sigma factor
MAQTMIEKRDLYIGDIPQTDVLYFAILEENLVMNVAPNVNYAIQSQLKEKKYNYIVIDLSNVTRIDSAGYGVLLNLITYFPRAQKVNIFIVNMNLMIKRIIELIGVPLIMYTYPSLESAIEKISELKLA